MAEAEVERVYRFRRSIGKWYVKIYEGFTLAPEKLIEEIGPFEYLEANQFAKELGIRDGDKGPDGKA